ncbi:exodeoxyribonuclease VII large subunit [Vibrio salinus]|uniref:exodeoxyribonuclease VII large subunit n=1 Tax=Vibrio salinus TaxID=2899784 RepID=UPI001E5635CE|nr:exodeoxyribonuclease VII large subunit [Vibrio salinus]MCE0493161.1 exodeoxyribonuclease VII large subunit [Vibrio salinus]
MFTSDSQNIFTVSRLNAEVRMLLENEMGMIWLVGEISNFSAPVSGHWYFTLKDSRAQVKCAMFRGNNRRVTFKPQSGQQVLIRARLSLYEPRGDYQLIAESMQPEGDGRLQQEFEKLKAKLAGEGLFSQSLKSPIPEHPRTVGIITSKTGAALFDILNVLKRRDPSLPVIIYPTMVQGEEASIQIAQAIGRANERDECDVLIVGRGGGSLEDLWCFNNEIVARTIAASRIPVISAVGHEVDITIADFVADMRAPTPSAAAELVSRDHSHKQALFDHHRQKLFSMVRYYLSNQKIKLQTRFSILEKHHPIHRLQRQSQHLDELTNKLIHCIEYRIRDEQQNLHRTEQHLKFSSPLTRIHYQEQSITLKRQCLHEAMKKHLTKSRHQLNISMETLDAVSPLATLKRGYSITQQQNGDIIKHAKDVKPGDTITTLLSDSEITSKVV